MKNAIIYGFLIGILSGLWVFIVRPASGQSQPIEYVSILIPLIGLYLGVRSFRAQQNGNLGFLEALVESFKILLVGGAVAVVASIVYVTEYNNGKIQDFSGQIFGALLVGVLFSLGVSALLTTKPNKID